MLEICIFLCCKRLFVSGYKIRSVEHKKSTNSGYTFKNTITFDLFWMALEWASTIFQMYTNVVQLSFLRNKHKNVGPIIQNFSTKCNFYIHDF